MAGARADSRALAVTACGTGWQFRPEEIRYGNQTTPGYSNFGFPLRIMTARPDD